MVRKKVVLNACGVKSLGGVKLFVEAFELLSEAETEITVLYSENEFFSELKNQSIENQYVTFIKLTNKRFLHPFLYLITNKNQRKLIESSDAIVHFGNFGFKTKIKSFVLIQNILPFVSKDLKNMILKIFISRSIKLSNYVVVQLKHVSELIGQEHKNKVIEIGEIEEVKVNAKNKSNKVVLFGSKVSNKNFNFMVNVLKSTSLSNEITVINPPKNITDFNCVYTETQDQTLSVMSENEIYFHASEYETVGLPLYEAQNLGLKVVAPLCSYTQYFSPESIFLYEMNNLKDALKKIEDAKSSDIKSIDTLNYSENWKIVLDNI